MGCSDVSEFEHIYGQMFTSPFCAYDALVTSIRMMNVKTPSWVQGKSSETETKCENRVHIFYVFLCKIVEFHKYSSRAWTVFLCKYNSKKCEDSMREVWISITSPLGTLVCFTLSRQHEHGIRGSTDIKCKQVYAACPDSLIKIQKLWQKFAFNSDIHWRNQQCITASNSGGDRNVLLAAKSLSSLPSLICKTP